MARIVINNAHLLSDNGLPQELDSELVSFSNSFLVHFQEFSPHLYDFRVKDCLHELTCELILEVKETLVSLEEKSEEKPYLVPVVACSFPAINLQKFNEKIGFDAYLQRLIVVQFQLKILVKLLLFCGEQDAVNLIFTVNDDDLDYLKFYRRFLGSEEQVAISRQEETKIVIITNMETYDRIVDFTDKIDREIRCALWRGQNANPIFRAYLKSNACL